jgi:lipopolysaccharide biosynthesis protein
MVEKATHQNPGTGIFIAFYLTQFYPTPYNDAWWGKGFTEWTNVVQARPRFRGHYQPHLLADPGFYDLRLSETREAQAELAKQFGVYGFCYYHYWFSDKRILERPLDEVLASGKPDFPFCICWANETWKKSWMRRNTLTLLEQTFSFEDDLAHIRHLLPVLATAATSVSRIGRCFSYIGSSCCRSRERQRKSGAAKPSGWFRRPLPGQRAKYLSCPGNKPGHRGL